METLEVRNPHETYHIFNQIATSVRMVPSILMIVAASKIIIFFVLNVGIFVGVIMSGWQIVTNAEKNQGFLRKDHRGVAIRNPDFSYSSQTQSQSIELE